MSKYTASSHATYNVGYHSIKNQMPFHLPVETSENSGLISLKKRGAAVGLRPLFVSF